MDHIAEKVRDYLGCTLPFLQDELSKGTKLKECYYYSEVNAMNKAYNILAKELGWQTLTTRELLVEHGIIK